MKETIELSPSILDYLNQEPEERKYWRVGYKLLEPNNGLAVAYDSETSAWKARERLARSEKHRRTTDAPFQATREQLAAFASAAGCTGITIIDESGQIVEEWTI